MSEEGAMASEATDRAVAAIWQALDERYQERRYTTHATVSNVVRDTQERIKHVQATIDGVANQAVLFDHGMPLYEGDVLEVENIGGKAVTGWRMIRRIASISANPYGDEEATIPVPTNIALTTDIRPAVAGGAIFPWVYVSWLSLGLEWGVCNYTVAVRENDMDDTFPDFVVIGNVATSTLTHSVGIDDSQTIIPCGSTGGMLYSNHFAWYKGRIKIESEKIDYARYAGQVSGVSGTGTASGNYFTDSGAAWDTNQWRDYVLIDSNDDLFLIVSNTATELLVVGTPVSGTYEISACFSGCTRGAGGTTAASHAFAQGVLGMSNGELVGYLAPNTDYNFRIRAHRPDGAFSVWSEWSSTTTGVDLDPPTAPTGLDVIDAINGVVLTWTGPGIVAVPDLAGFWVYAADDQYGNGSELVKKVGIRSETFYDMYPGTSRYFNLRAVDNWDNESDFAEATWLLGTAQTGVGNNLCTNSDFERDMDGDNWPEPWLNDGWRVTWGDYGFENSKGLRFNMIYDTDRYCFWPYPGTSRKIRVEIGEWYTASVYFWSDEDEDVIRYDGNFNDGYLSLSICTGLTDYDGYYGISFETDYSNVVVEHGDNGWRRVIFSYQIKEEDVWPGYWDRYYLLVKFNVRNMRAPQVVHADRVQLEKGRYPTEWSPASQPPYGPSGARGLLIDPEGIQDPDGNLIIDFEGRLRAGLPISAMSADPNAPEDSQAVMWLSDGTDSGDDGDILITSVDSGGTPVTDTLFDYSAGGLPGGGGGGGDTKRYLSFAAFDQVGSGVTGATTNLFLATVPATLTLKEFHIAVMVVSNNGPSHYYTIQLNRQSGGSILSLNTSALSADTWYVLSSTGRSDSLSTSNLMLVVHIVKTGTPGSFNAASPQALVEE